MAASERLKNVLSHLKHHEDSHIQSTVTSAVPHPLPLDNLTYTLPNHGILTHGQRQFYEENGYVVIPKLVCNHDLETYRQRFQAICEGKVKVPGLTIMRDVSIANSEFVPGEKAITKIQSFTNDDVLFSYCQHEKLLEYVESFVGPNIRAMHTMLINKPPDPGKKSSRHPMHQDLYYFPFRPADRIVCSWTAMQTVNRENGCLVVIPGSHRGQLLEHEYPNWEGGVNSMYYGVRDYDSSKPRLHLEMEAGDTVFFHPLLIHGSGMNKTQGFRKSISSHYASTGCHYIDMNSSTNYANEIVNIAKRRFGNDVELDVADVWKLLSRHVKGEELTLA